MENCFTQLLLHSTWIAQSSFTQIQARLPLRKKNLTDIGIAVPQYHLVTQTQMRRTSKSPNQEHA